MITEPSPEDVAPRALTYHVVAMSMPIVYTADGDHDPNGLIYTLAAYKPLLEWARDRWRDNPNLTAAVQHRQRLQILVDALVRYENMRVKVKQSSHDHWLLRQYEYSGGHAGDHGGDGQDDHGDGHGDDGEPLNPHRKAFIQNYLHTVDDIVTNLMAVSADEPGGHRSAIDPDPEVRAQWLVEYRHELAAAEADVAHWFAEMEADPARRFDADALAAASGLTADRVRRLLLNDYQNPPPTPPADGTSAPSVPYDRFNPMKPIPLVRPLVLRARQGDDVEVEFENSISNRRVGFHLQGSGLAGGKTSNNIVDGVRGGDGAKVGNNPDTTVAPGQKRHHKVDTEQEGIWIFNDLCDLRGNQRGTNAHGLFGTFIVEPEGTVWRDPETGEILTGTTYADGLYVDIIVVDEDTKNPKHADFVDFHHDDIARSHREYTVFIHDEPEIHSVLHGGHAGVMPLSYRAEPMPNRVPHQMRRLAEATDGRALPPPGEIDFAAVKLDLDWDLNETYETARTADGTYLERIGGEEQHHSSWLFGDPVTPILYGYKGDPMRIRVVHSGVKETHVFHLHVHQWRAIPQDTAAPSTWKPGEPRGSAILDSITVGPQAAVTIDPLYGMGSRQHAPGDIIWHCHLYPHFHHGMWGVARSYDKLVDGTRALPDGSPTQPLLPLPGRVPPTPNADGSEPGFPWFVDATYPRKSPPPPAVSDAWACGRRRLLGMGNASADEQAAFAPGVVDANRPGQVFVNLDELALDWNARADLDPPRVIRYELDVRSGHADYNNDGWHDRNAHYYKLTGITIDQLDAAGDVVSTTTAPVPPDDPAVGEISAFFPRANHGDIVEWQVTNTLTSLPADDFDHIAPPVECGLHVHLVKFDVLAADGSCTGWNYLTGGSCREVVGNDEPGRLDRRVTLHRWVVDEEFGPCFFHDHLLANYRQKRGLAGALVAEPVGSEWFRSDQTTVAWSDPEAVVVPGAETAVEPYREFGLNIGDFLPLYDGGGNPLGGPEMLGSDEDPGVMGVNFRCEPLTVRGPYPSEWFASSDSRPLPATPVFRTYPGERIRLRLVQGSHEEQHSFAMHGMRWRNEWQNPAARLVNQQTIGLSEVFTFEMERTPLGGIELTYGPGDYLWKFTAMDDLWLGCWGLIRAVDPSTQMFSGLLPLANLDTPLVHLTSAQCQALAAEVAAQSAVPVDIETGLAVREYTVAARRKEHHYDGPGLTDPWGLVYLVAGGSEPYVDHHGVDTGHLRAVDVYDDDQPLVLRARPGEVVKVTLINEVLPLKDHHHFEVDLDTVSEPFGPEVDPPRLPLDERARTVSPRVSLHPSLLRYDVRHHDGAYVGDNDDGTVPSLATSADHGDHGGGGGGDGGEHEEGGGEVVFRDGAHGPNHRTYWWYADPALAPDSHTDGPGTVCYLYDMADIRNHRHHGLIGALVVEPGDCTPVQPGDATTEQWYGANVHLVDDTGGFVANEQVLFLQDGLRFFVAGNPLFPVPDAEPDDDAEDSGLKAINFRSAMVNHRIGLKQTADAPVRWDAEVGQRLWLRLVGAADKPRNHSFTVHDQAWPLAPWVADGPMVGSLSGVTADSAYDIELEARHPGDHAFRNGAFLWSVEQGMWGMLRVK